MTAPSPEEEKGVPKGYRADTTGAIKRATIVLVCGCHRVPFQEVTGSRKRTPAEEKSPGLKSVLEAA